MPGARDYCLSIRRIVGSLAGGALLIAVAGCSGSPSSPTPAVADIRGSIALEGDSSLVFQDGGQLDAERAKIERIVKQTLTAVRALIPLEGITVVVLSDPSGAIPELDFGGRADAGTIRLSFNPGSAVMARSLDIEVFPLLAHEIHHVARFRTAGFATNLMV